MKLHYLLLAIFFTASNCFADSALPDTEALMRAQTDFVTIKNKNSVFSVSICPTQLCDLFEGTESSHQQVADYAYLYAAYVAEYIDFSLPSDNGTRPTVHFVAEALDKGYAKEVLDHYAGEYHCGQDSLKCVLRGLRKTASIKHFSENHDEGTTTKTLVDDDAGK